MPQSASKLSAQLVNHISRSRGGVEPGDSDWLPDQLIYSDVNCFMIVPSTWKLSRGWSRENSAREWSLVLPEPTNPPTQTIIDRLQANH